LAGEHGSPAAPVSPAAATTVTWRSAAACSAEFRRPTSARVAQCSPPVWPAPLIEMTPPCDKPSRSAATDAATALGVLFSDAGLTRTRAITAPGATACTISASTTSSSLASQGEADPARLVTVRSRAAGRPNRRSNLARSWRMSLTWGGDSHVWASSGNTTV
jgi:hypothetical protein